jgi:prephenate dehydratase
MTHDSALSTQNSLLRLAFLGPAGTYSEQAALLHDPAAQLVPMASISAVVYAVDSGMADEGVVPIENSLEGGVVETQDLLVHETDLRIRRELVIPIEHCLIVRPGTTAADIQVIYSHPQALGQTRRFIERCFPKAQVEAALSTSGAVQEAVTRGDAAGISSRRAAEVFGGEILAAGIQDFDNNVTRFVVLAREDAPPTGADRTSIAFSFEQDRAGSLVEVLQQFASREINLSRIESRPTREALGKYTFLVDLDVHRSEPRAADALEAVAELASELKVFGSYPRWQAP